MNGKILRNNTDYTLLYKNNKKRGSAGIVVTGKRQLFRYIGGFLYDCPCLCEKASVTGLKAVYARTGKAVKPKSNGETWRKEVKEKKRLHSFLSEKQEKRYGTSLCKRCWQLFRYEKMKFKIR